jgi:hypothetical protein
LLSDGDSEWGLWDCDKNLDGGGSSPEIYCVLSTFLKKFSRET